MTKITQVDRQRYALALARIPSPSAAKHILAGWGDLGQMAALEAIAATREAERVFSAADVKTLTAAAVRYLESHNRPDFIGQFDDGTFGFNGYIDICGMITAALSAIGRVEDGKSS